MLQQTFLYESKYRYGRCETSNARMTESQLQTQECQNIMLKCSLKLKLPDTNGSCKSMSEYDN